MDYIEICENDYSAFHELANAYYREGEDADTPQEEIDIFIRFLFEKVINHEINGFIAKDKNAYVGFALWGVDTEGSEFSEIPGFGTILEIGFIPSYRSKGNGKELVLYIENYFCKKNVNNCYVSAYGPAQKFWSYCGYVESGKVGHLFLGKEPETTEYRSRWTARAISRVSKTTSSVFCFEKKFPQKLHKYH